MTVVLLLVFLLCFSIHSLSADYAKKSVLSEGKWVQLQVKENAIYKLTADDIKKMGFNDPAKIKIYGYGGWALEQDFRMPYIDDLPEVAVYVNKGASGTFNYLLFYGRGAIKWTYDTNKAFFVHQNNPYANYGYYFITESGEGPKEMPEVESDPLSPTMKTVDSFDDYRVHEQDLVSLLNSGRELFGESFTGNSSQNFKFNIPGIINENGKIRLSFAAAPPSPTPVILSIGNKELFRLPITFSSVSGGYRKATLVDGIRDWVGDKSESTTVNISFASTGAVANLNFIALNVKRELRFYNEAYTFFRNKDNRTEAIRYCIKNTSDNLQVWNLTDVQDIWRVKTTKEGANLTFGAASGVIPEYVLVDVASQSFPTPAVVGEIKKQNLHGLDQTDMVIISPEIYFPLAKELAEKHRELQSLKVEVVQPEWIYNEFSSGTPDATSYRRFMKMFYDRAITEGNPPRYLLLYGAGYFDNRRLTKEGARLDGRYYLLTYQFENSTDENSSYGTDDYFGFLGNSTGVNLNSDSLAIGVGRFPVNTYERAKNVLTKTLNYMENKDYGSWKNTVIFTADDTGKDSYCGFAIQADELANIVEQKNSSYRVVKSYMDAFHPVDVNSKRNYPDAKQKLMNTLKEGCFLFNYTGHGSQTSMSEENMMRSEDIRQMKFKSLPLWITATCDFGRFDDTKMSAGVEVLLNKNSAGIALFTTTRVVLGDLNHRLNRPIIKHTFTKNGDQQPALGDIFRRSKWDCGSDHNKLNWVLLGDPALQLNYPEWNIELENINDEPIESNTLTNFRALDYVTLQGVVKDGSGNPVENFNGSLQATIFDGKQTIRAVTNPPDEVKRWAFFDYPNIVYKGDAKVENGRFNLSFRVPLDISYDASNSGKMNFYAWDENLRKDAAGNFIKYTLSGTADTVPPKDFGPEIEEMYLNTAAFQDEDEVNETPFFYASVFDEYGINRTGTGLGHGITISIDNNPAWLYNLNNYFIAGDVQGSGTIGFSIPELPEGPHTLVFKVWDIMNNSTTDSLRFTVVKGLVPKLSDVRVAPNPAKERAVFYLEHNRPESVLEVDIRVYDLMGRIVWSRSETGTSGGIYPVEWDLTNGGGCRVAPGVYVYQAIVKTIGGKEATKSKKLIVL